MSRVGLELLVAVFASPSVTVPLEKAADEPATSSRTNGRRARVPVRAREDLDAAAGLVQGERPAVGQDAGEDPVVAAVADGQRGERAGVAVEDRAAAVEGVDVRAEAVEVEGAAAGDRDVPTPLRPLGMALEAAICR